MILIYNALCLYISHWNVQTSWVIRRDLRSSFWLNVRYCYSNNLVQRPGIMGSGENGVQPQAFNWNVCRIPEKYRPTLLSHERKNVKVVNLAKWIVKCRFLGRSALKSVYTYHRGVSAAGVVVAVIVAVIVVVVVVVVVAVVVVSKVVMMVFSRERAERLEN